MVFNLKIKVLIYWLLQYNNFSLLKVEIQTSLIQHFNHLIIYSIFNILIYLKII